MVQTRNLNVHEYLAHELMQRVSATIEHLSLSATKFLFLRFCAILFLKNQFNPLSLARALSHHCTRAHQAPLVQPFFTCAVSISFSDLYSVCARCSP